MTDLEKNEQLAFDNGLKIDYVTFSSPRIKGLYCDGSIALNTALDTSAEKVCVLSEELGHHFTSSGIILDQSITANRKQEYKARLWAYNNQIGLVGLIHAYNHGCQSLYEIAEYLNVTEHFLKEALSCYHSKYGICKELYNYIIFFEPCLTIMKKLK